MAKFETVDLKDAAGVPIHSMIDVDGRRINTFFKPPEVTAGIIHNMVDLPIRDDDVMFCSAPKSGKYTVCTLSVKFELEYCTIRQTLTE